MLLTDIVYLAAARLVPGRSVLYSLFCQYFSGSATDPGGGATSYDLILPPPQAGFVRLWDLLWVQLSAPANTNEVDVLLLPNNNLAVPISSIVFATNFLPSGFLPYIGQDSFQHRLLNAIPVRITGAQPLLVGNLDNLVIRSTIVAASGQTTSARGRYCDFPI